MTRRAGKTAAATAFIQEQAAKHRRTSVADIAATLKQRTRAAHLSGLTSVTLHLPIGDARAIADALTDWAARHSRDEVRDAIQGRKDGTT
ncbi:hypothetical protein [Brachybacterium sp.]|uniref:hypothetical protein n=1 Tax=Brachybacterium sp. TaxID=1891286 RepID=UPI002ED435F0